MTDDTVVMLAIPRTIDDALTEVLRAGARELLAHAIEAEVSAFLAGHERLTPEGGRRRVVRHGHGPERQIATEVGLAVESAAARRRRRVGVSDRRKRGATAVHPSHECTIARLRPRGAPLAGLVVWRYSSSTGAAGCVSVLLRRCRCSAR